MLTEVCASLVQKIDTCWINKSWEKGRKGNEKRKMKQSENIAHHKAIWKGHYIYCHNILDCLT